MKIIFLLTTLLISITNFTYAQWIEQYRNLSTQVFFYSISMADESNGIIVGTNSSYTSGIIYRTTNGGENWSEVPGVGPILYSVCSPAPNIFLAVGKNGAIVKTTDGGSSWYSRSSGTSKYLWSVFFIDANTGWAAGGTGNTNLVAILKTTDQGETWQAKTCFKIGLLNEIHFVSNQIGWAVGYQFDISQHDRSIIVKTTDGGETWQTLNSGVTDCRLPTVFFLNENLGWVGGLRDYYGSKKVVLLKTTNGGDTWVNQISNKLGSIGSLRMCDANRGWAVGGTVDQYGLNYETTDGGNSWIHRTEFNNISMNSIFFLNPTTGWGNSLTRIYKYEGLTDVNENTSFPHQHSLSQNYPNPFNPTTMIKYTIPKLSLIVVKVFDALGNEITVLVNEEKPIGTYKIDFNASNLPSGVYIYRLQAADFVETKKMILLK